MCPEIDTSFRREEYYNFWPIFGVFLPRQKLYISLICYRREWSVFWLGLDVTLKLKFFPNTRVLIADGDCSHEIKRRLLLGRKVMTNLDSILKITDITLPTKVHLVKAMVSPVVMYGCESWAIKKAEH